MSSPAPPSASRKSPSIPKRIRSLVISGTLFYLLVLLMITLLQRKLIYHPGRVPELELPGGEVREVQTTTRDGIVLNGWHWSSSMHATQATDRRTVLFFTGNAGNRSHRVPICRLLNAMGCDVLIFDYRGYGENTGAPSEEGLANDAQAVWDYATQQAKLRPETLLIYGESLGGAVATRLAAEVCAAETPPGGLVLRSTFSSMVDTASYHYPWLPVNWLLVDRFPSVTHIANVSCPCLMLHGTRDRIVPLKLGRRLFAALPPQSQSRGDHRFVELPSAGHNDVLATSEPEVRGALNDLMESIWGGVQQRR